MPNQAAAHSLEPSAKSVALPKELSEVAEMLKSQDLAVIDQAVEAWSDFAAIKPEARETLENPGPPRDNGAVIAGQD